jgi:hypothetical protein
MRILLKGLTVALFFVGTSMLAHSQEYWKKAPVGDGSGHTREKLAFFQRVSECGGEKGLLLKVVNQGERARKLSWNNAFLLDEEWQRTSQSELKIGGAERKVGRCGSTLWIPFPEGNSATFALRDLRIE